MTIRDGFVSRSKQNPSSRSRKGASQEPRSVEEGGQDTVSRHLARACAQCDQHVYFCNLISYLYIYIYGVSVYIYRERERGVISEDSSFSWKPCSRKDMHLFWASKRLPPRKKSTISCSLRRC